MTRLVWFRNDLRVHDNPALAFARRDNEAPVVAVVFVPEQQWRQHGLGERRINLNKAAICALQDSLSALNIPLLIAPGESFRDNLGYLQELLTQFEFSEINFNIEYELNERQRDRQLVIWCRDRHITANRFHDQCLLPPGEVLTGDAQMYKVFTPFRKAWLSQMSNLCPPPCAAPAVQKKAVVPQAILDFWQQHSQPPAHTEDDLWAADEDSGHEQLAEFLDRDVLYYQEQRDLPDLDATSRLSFYLALGLLSPRQCLYSAWQKNQCMLSGGETGIDTWISELIWREFYRHLIVAWPELCKHRAFRPETEDVPWRDSDSDFARWCAGETGYPIVDAAMKQLLDQGWMHNRLR
ncbi:MAG TPA: deoxyribodipyrimidine photo-lyase, partial [Oceanospirillales bacterium]|nr:deoxyribodipyrimidine photo-lyase [Oceanospirillales bacterium]